MTSDPARVDLPILISTHFADGAVIEIRSNQNLDHTTLTRIYALLAPHASTGVVAKTVYSAQISAAPAPIDPALSTTLSQRVAFARTHAGLTQSALARAISVRPQSIQSLESGKSRGTSLIVQIARATGVNPDWLYDGSGSPERAPPHLGD